MAPAFTAPQLQAPPAKDWITNGCSLTNERYSPLKQINRDNVAGFTAAIGERRFISVRSDADRILTCFLEAVSPERMLVHDLLHERQGNQWQLKVSSYAKLRLAPEAIVASLKRLGLDGTLESGPRGMVRVLASRPS